MIISLYWEMSYPAPTAEELAAHEAGAKQSLEFIEKANWKVAKEEPTIKYYTASYPNSSFSMVKSVVSIPAPHDKIVGILNTVRTIDAKTPDAEKEGANEQYLFGQQNDENQTSYLYISLQSGSRLVSDRDFVMLRRYYKFGDKELWHHAAFDNGDKLIPPVKKYVRGTITLQTYVLEKDPENADAYRLTFIVHANPSGSIPAMIYNTVATSQGESAKKIREDALK